MKSMTSYGYTEFQSESLHLTLEIKSYNNRYLDIFVNLPPYLNPIEPKIREFISSKINRGRIEIYIKTRELEEDLTVLLDKKAVSSYMKILNELKEISGIDENIHLSHLLRMDGVLKTLKNRDVDTFWNILLPLLEKCYKEYDQGRIREGKETKLKKKKNITTIREQIIIVNYSPPTITLRDGSL